MRNSPDRTPLLRPLARSLLLALATAPMAAAFAGDLDNQQAEVTIGDPVEAWTLKNGSKLTLRGTAHQIRALDSDVAVSFGGVIERASIAGSPVAVILDGRSTLTADRGVFLGGVQVMKDSIATFRGSTIYSQLGTGLLPTDAYSIGVDLLSLFGDVSDNTRAIIDEATIVVSETPAGNDLNNGHGVRLMQGQVDIRNNSQIYADNAGILLAAYPGVLQPIAVRIDNSLVQSGRNAAIWVRPTGDAAEYDITVANDSQLKGGDGNLLNVQNFVTSGRKAEVTFTVDDSRLAGNVNFDSASVTGSLDVFLRNKAQIDGRFINVTSASIDSDSTWLMTGDSTVGHLALGNTGTVALGNGSTFNTLTVDTFDGAGGTLLFNTQLGDDSSATDRLIIKGDANGQANLRVLNAGGAGAKTDKGIELIRVGGASNAQFDLQGRAVGGQYEYFLFKDATNGGWYLRSELAGTPDPCVVDPTLPECTPVDPVDPVDPIDPTPVLRPEAGAYLANQFAMDQLLRHGWRDRQGGNTSAVDGVRGWARVDGTQSKLSAVEDQLDLRVDRSRLQLGADIGVFDNGQGRVGVMGTLAKSDATSRSQLTGYSARGKVNGGALGVYGNWSNDALYVDTSVQRGQFRNRVQGEGLAEERYDSDIWQSSLEAGYRFGIGQIGSTALSLQPELQLIYTDANTDRHEEANGTVVRSLGDSGLSGRAGLRLQGEGRSAAGASVSPYVVANWYRDGASNGMAFDDEALKASVPRNRYELNAGARVDFRSGLSAWGGFGVMRGDHGYREATANLSMSYRW